MPTPHQTRSQGPGSSTYQLPPWLNPRASSVAPLSILVAQSIILTQEQLAHLSVVEDESEASSQVFTQPILSPSPPRSITEPSPVQHFDSQLASTPQLLSSPLCRPGSPIEEAFYQYNIHPSLAGTSQHLCKTLWLQCDNSCPESLGLQHPFKALIQLQIPPGHPH